jgi:hypothetical protein
MTRSVILICLTVLIATLLGGVDRAVAASPLQHNEGFDLGIQSFKLLGQSHYTEEMDCPENAECAEHFEHNCSTCGVIFSDGRVFLLKLSEAGPASFRRLTTRALTQRILKPPRV